MTRVERMIIEKEEKCPFCSLDLTTIMRIADYPFVNRGYDPLYAEDTGVTDVTSYHCPGCGASFFTSRDGVFVAFTHGIAHFCDECGMIVKDARYVMKRFSVEKSFVCPSCDTLKAMKYSFLTKRWTNSRYEALMA